jgi:hypothetical protein
VLPGAVVLNAQEGVSAMRKTCTPGWRGLVFFEDLAVNAHDLPAMARETIRWRLTMTVERGILLVVGAIVVLSVLLAVYHNINWLWLTGILGLHLVQASFTGMCPVVMALKKMGLPSRAGFAG